MERLVKYDEENGSYYVDVPAGDSDEENYNNMLLKFNELAAKLCEYENEEEAHRLMCLPCTLGDTLYGQYSKQSDIINGTVIGFSVNKEGYIYIKLDIPELGTQTIFAELLGKTWFLTEEEARESLINGKKN